MSESAYMDLPVTDTEAMERDLRGWAWAAGGWSALHALGGIALVLSGDLGSLPSGGHIALVALMIPAWTSAAVASWLFHKSFEAKAAVVAANASVLAGALVGVALLLSTEARASERLLAGFECIAHVWAGLGLGAALRRARPYLYFP
jgi:hypothetical protein